MSRKTPKSARSQQEKPRRRTPLSRVLRSLFGTMVMLAALAAGAVAIIWAQVSGEGPLKSEKAVIIEPGSSSRDIAAMLERQGVISSAELFMAALAVDRYRGVRAHIKAGEFAIPARASIRQVLDILRHGKAIVHKLTIPEGFSTMQVLKRLREHPALSGEITIEPGEGTLLPDTYVFTRGESRDAILRRMREAQRKLLDELWPKRARGLPFKSREEAVILASLVEKETAKPEERRRIAAVFINRLKKGIKLQSDPTIIYGITKGAPLGRPIRKSEIERKTPWNTYQFYGLPKTPIANPGRDSIAAVLDPLEVDDLYFVADGTGGHVFAATLREHNRNVRRWRAISARRRGGGKQGVTAGAKDGGKRPESGVEQGKDDPAGGNGGKGQGDGKEAGRLPAGAADKPQIGPAGGGAAGGRPTVASAGGISASAAPAAAAAFVPLPRPRPERR